MFQIRVRGPRVPARAHGGRVPAQARRHQLRGHVRRHQQIQSGCGKISQDVTGEPFFLFHLIKRDRIRVTVHVHRFAWLQINVSLFPIAARELSVSVLVAVDLEGLERERLALNGECLGQRRFSGRAEPLAEAEPGEPAAPEAHPDQVLQQVRHRPQRTQSLRSFYARGEKSFSCV